MNQPQGIYDARQLGRPKMFVLGAQHMFAMFGATVLVPALTGMSVSATLLFAGLGTLLFHFLTKWKVPAFLGSSFAFIGGYQAIAPMIANEDGSLSSNTEMLPYACFGVVLAGLLYVVLAALFKVFGTKAVMRYFPPIVTGPIIICIGLTLSSIAITNCRSNWAIALVAIAIVVVCNIWGKGMVKIIPILLGVVGSYGVAAVCQAAGMEVMDPAKVQALLDAPWIGLPFRFEDTLFGLFSRPNVDSGMLLTSAVTIMPLALATMVEHIGGICAISSTCERNFLQDPGLHRTLLGDGMATSLAALFGAPANTTYGENTGVLALSRVYDPRVIRIAAGLAILLSFSPKFAALVSAMPTATMGGVSMVLYGMISAVGVRNIVENQVDFTNSRNVIIAAIIMVLAIGVNYSGAVTFSVGSIEVSLSGLAVAAIAGIALNAVLPGKDYEFGEDEKGDTSVNFQV
ncbi:uracil-xanthine permease family protein [Pseudoflavonifractor sp. An184]|uniref:uracil-xanthine permease family protein n=1 Tax=Pseudoflavonifractor sp. An184 TaxID=1965576 RepID=UPI000B3A62E0|nr:uracil-xanthine permease family protein [Pseudoflavonifractor sp. An184]OUP58238.1 ABC transporter permease [Pseudoflavonifractor sp. An184]